MFLVCSVPLQYASSQYFRIDVYFAVKLQRIQMNKPSTLKDFQIVSKLGQGSFSCVYKVKRNDDKTFYALKKVKIGQMCQKEKENALNQVRILASINHPNIINYKQAFFDDTSQTLNIVMEIAEAGDILNKTEAHIKAKTYFKQSEIWKAFVHMSKGLKALHDMGILHRDLKCANVFLTADGVYKLGDLNVSKVTKKGMARTQTGTPYYTSPEVWKDRPYDLKCDIWSLGCVIYEMAALKPPFRASNLKQLYNKIQKGIFQRIPAFFSDDLSNMVNLCLKVNPVNRPSTQELLAYPQLARNVASEINRNESKKSNSLLKTIQVPKNLKSLKQVLPEAKYQDIQNQSAEISRRAYQRINSAHSLGKQLPNASKFISIKTPKLSNANVSKQQIDVFRKPPESNRVESRMQREQSRNIRDKSYQYVRPSPQRVNYSREIMREKSKEILKDISVKSKEVRDVREKLNNLLAQRNNSIRRNQSQGRQISPKIKNALDIIKKAEKNFKEIITERRKDRDQLKPRSQSFDKENRIENKESKENNIQTKKKYYLPVHQRRYLPPRQKY